MYQAFPRRPGNQVSLGPVQTALQTSCRHVVNEVTCLELNEMHAIPEVNAILFCLKALGHDISKRFVTKFKRIVCGPSFR